MKLTDTKLRSLKASDKIQKISDGGGLYIHVTPAGGKLWRLAYRFGGKQKTLYLGQYPDVSLIEARRLRDEARAQLANGLDPAQEKKRDKAEAAARAQEALNTYERVAREWIEKQAPTWSEGTLKKTLARQVNDIFPIIGGLPIRGITAPIMLDALRGIEQRSPNTAHRAKQDCSRIFCYGVATGRADFDPTAALKGALTPHKQKHYASITDPEKVGQMLRDIDAYQGSVVIRAALRLPPYLLVRPGELLRAEWAEINLDAAEWRIPAERMKMRELHIVPLSRQALKILADLYQYTGGRRYLFSNMRGKDAPYSDTHLRGELASIGYGKGKMSLHGFRSLGTTLLNELGYNRDWIERQLAHSERNTVRAAYNRAEYLPERRRMMQEWADYLDSLRAQAGQQSTEQVKP